MNISLTINADNVEDMQAQLRVLLAGTAVITVSGATAPLAPIEPEPKQTAAQKRAAEKAAKEAAEKAAADAAAAEAAKAPPTETEKQDAKDEAAEQKAPEPLKLTHDHIRTMLGGYVMAYGMEKAQADGPGFVGFPKISEVPDDQALIAKAVIAIADGIEKNPNKRDMAGDGISAEKIAELKPIVEAAKAVK
ncbi:hypothetical protein [Bradyrhizobium sp.]|jgi:hypothetical protein|uniref:hypothetical protein n=1 Tax=Bradyrhizobium sp. TaxID=376 RepID=UPI002DDCABD0|nr:hypothetical protein [Bradyrhizobium sp.]HEV2155453.1 hypothetical protein [Bradyrhizobium sp.]